MMVYYGVYPGWGIVALPLLTVVTLVTAFAVGIWSTALNVRYRDVKYVIPFLLQLWLFASPVAYAASLIPSRWRLVYSLNPMAGTIAAYRWALLGQPWHPDLYFAVSIVATIAILITGVVYFRATERTFADVI
jgi:lipopolysaccharide transport system permease protein